MKDDEVLLLERPKPHVWEFPGGRIEKNETLRETIEREVEEEAGLRVKPGLLLPIREADDVVAVFGLCKHKGDKVVLGSVEGEDKKLGYKWVKLAEMPDKIDGVSLARSVKAFLREIRDINF